jgi:hypothetical protein
MPNLHLDLEGVPKVLWPGLRMQFAKMVIDNPKEYVYNDFSDLFKHLAQPYMQVQNWDNKTIYAWLEAVFIEARRQKFIKE